VTARSTQSSAVKPGLVAISANRGMVTDLDGLGGIIGESDPGHGQVLQAYDGASIAPVGMRVNVGHRIPSEPRLPLVLDRLFGRSDFDREVR
jgi:hypothetical protein